MKKYKLWCHQTDTKGLQHRVEIIVEADNMDEAFMIARKENPDYYAAQLVNSDD